MLLIGTCSKCKTEIKLDIGDKTPEQVKKELSKWESFNCPGKHTEVESPYPSYWNLDKWKLVEGKSPTEEDWVKDLKEKVGEIFTTKELEEKFNVKGFSMGLCAAKRKDNGKDAVFNYVHSPKGERYYFAI